MLPFFFVSPKFWNPSDLFWQVLFLKVVSKAQKSPRLRKYIYAQNGVDNVCVLCQDFLVALEPTFENIWPKIGLEKTEDLQQAGSLR